MATRAAIQFNYQEALRRAGEVDGIAEDLDKTRRELNSVLRTVSDGWKGDSARQYNTKGEKLGGQIDVSARDLRQVASEIRRIARIIYDTEMRNLEIALRRKDK